MWKTCKNYSWELSTFRHDFWKKNTYQKSETIISYRKSLSSEWKDNQNNYQNRTKITSHNSEISHISFLINSYECLIIQVFYFLLHTLILTVTEEMTEKKDNFMLDKFNVWQDKILPKFLFLVHNIYSTQLRMKKIEDQEDYTLIKAEYIFHHTI